MKQRLIVVGGLITILVVGSLIVWQSQTGERKPNFTFATPEPTLTTNEARNKQERLSAATRYANEPTSTPRFAPPTIPHKTPTVTHQPTSTPLPDVRITRMWVAFRDQGDKLAVKCSEKRWRNCGTGAEIERFWDSDDVGIGKFHAGTRFIDAEDWLNGVITFCKKYADRIADAESIGTRVIDSQLCNPSEGLWMHYVASGYFDQRGLRLAFDTEGEYVTYRDWWEWAR